MQEPKKEGGGGLQHPLLQKADITRPVQKWKQ